MGQYTLNSPFLKGGLREILTPQVKPGWDFLIGRRKDIRQVMVVFHISSADMITLDAALLLRSPKSGRWVRIDGQLSSDQFIHGYQILEK